MRRIALLAIFGSLGVLALVINTGTSLATGSVGSGANYTFRATLPPFHSDTTDYKLFQKNPEDVVMRELTIVPGGHTGWHFHPGPTYVLVVQGTDSLYEANDPTCTATTYGPGQGFVEPGDDVHISRNEGTTNLVLYITFLDVPVGGAFRLDAPRPGNCPF